MPKQRIILIIGIVLAILAVFMIKVYLDKQRQEANRRAQQELEERQRNQTSVLVAKKDIPAGSVIDSESLEVNIVPNQFVQPQAVTSLDSIAGMMTIAPITKGEQIIRSKLAYTRQSGDLAQVTPIGKRAITISIDNVASLAGMIKAGDYVDVIVTVPVPVQTPEGKQVNQAVTIPLFQNVLVLAVGQETDVVVKKTRYQRVEEQKEPSPLITLALAPQEANLIAFVQEQGKIRLVLRSPTDAKTEPIQPINWETFFQYVLPQPPKPAKEEPEISSYVEIYRGLNKEKVPLYK
jgi:pilus assembly protein CpaB